MSAPRMDDRIRELFDWIKDRQSDGVVVTDMVAEFGQWAGRNVLTPKFEMIAPEHSVTFSFPGSKLVIRNDEDQWKLA